MMWMGGRPDHTRRTAVGMVCGLDLVPGVGLTVSFRHAGVVRCVG